MNGEMIRHEGGQVAPFQPHDLDEARRLCTVLHSSGLLPRSVRSPEAAFLLLATGRELGLMPMQSIRSIHVVEGRPELSADLMRALVMRSEVCEYFQLVESSDQLATYEAKRTDAPRPTTLTWTIEQARRAGLAGKNNWKNYPEAMLRARCIAALAREVFPDVVSGVYVTGEISDSRGEPQSRPMRQASAPPVEAEVVPDDVDGQVRDGEVVEEAPAQADGQGPDLNLDELRAKFTALVHEAGYARRTVDAYLREHDKRPLADRSAAELRALLDGLSSPEGQEHFTGWVKGATTHCTLCGGTGHSRSSSGRCDSCSSGRVSMERKNEGWLRGEQRERT